MKKDQRLGSLLSAGVNQPQKYPQLEIRLLVLGQLSEKDRRSGKSGMNLLHFGFEPERCGKATNIPQSARG